MLIPFLKLALVFILMLCGIRFKLGLGWSVLGGSLLLALVFGIPLQKWLDLSLAIFSDRTVLTVWGVVILVLSLSSLMEKTKQAERFMESLAHKIASPLVRMVFFPVLIGLLPMPGGAVFSAPMINAVAKNLHVPEEDKSLINYWFRHTAELSWPLFPALILAAGMAGLSTPQLACWTAPMSLVFAATGWLFFIRPLRVNAADGMLPPQSGNGGWGAVFVHGAPIFVALGGAIFMEIALSMWLPGYPMDDGVLVALVLAVALCLRQNRLGLGAFAKTVAHPHVRGMIFMVGALGIFKNVLAGGGVVEQLLAAGTGPVALWMTALLLPVVVGALTGMMMACVGSTFPLLIVLAQSVSGPEGVTPWLVLGMVAALTGCMATPLHICFVLSCEYFKVGLASSLRRLLAPSALFLLCGLGYFLLIR